MSVVQIPITNQSLQSFTITLPGNSANITLDFFIYWNRIGGYWQMNIGQGGTDLITGLPMLSGQNVYSSLLYQFTYLGIGQLLIARLSPTPNDSPGETDWGTNFILIWGP